MASLSRGAAFGVFLHVLGHASVTPAPNEDRARADLGAFLQGLGHAEHIASRVADGVCTHWDGDGPEGEAVLRMKALQWLQIEARRNGTRAPSTARPRSLVATAALASEEAPRGFPPVGFWGTGGGWLFGGTTPVPDRSHDNDGVRPESPAEQASEAQQIRQADEVLRIPPGTCGDLDHAMNADCKGDVEWVFGTGRNEAWAPDVYWEIQEITGHTLQTGSIEDFQLLFHCGMEYKCPIPPCGRSCGREQGDMSPTEIAELGVEPSCGAHPGCADIAESQACCPDTDGLMQRCCYFRPPDASGPPIIENIPPVPAEEVREALHGGEFLGPLLATKCDRPLPAHMEEGKALHECATLCGRGANCKAISFTPSEADAAVGLCMLWTECHTAYARDGTSVYVKNVDSMTPHRVPTRQVENMGAGGAVDTHFFLLGDWGAGSCPGHASMHYVHAGVEPNTPRWLTDHHAQENVAHTMGTVAQSVEPFMVVNIGDNFYWGGIEDARLGGRGVHDRKTWVRGFENVYTHAKLMVPWLSIMGNHDYGGDGCFSNVRAQFDYTIRDLLHNDRWKMPSQYFSHRVEMAEGWALEVFMLDSNIEDSSSGRHGGICAQHICHETAGQHHGVAETVPEAACQNWFASEFRAQGQWLDNALRQSTARWKVIGIHHKPHGVVAQQLQGIKDTHGVQLLVTGHTHEMSFYDSWEPTGGPVLAVVGGGGGAQGAPGCGDAAYCSGTTDYGFVDLALNRDQMQLTYHKHDGTQAFQRFICHDGRASDRACPTTPPPPPPPPPPSPPSPAPAGAPASGDTRSGTATGPAPSGSSSGSTPDSGGDAAGASSGSPDGTPTPAAGSPTPGGAEGGAEADPAAANADVAAPPGDDSGGGGGGGLVVVLLLLAIAGGVGYFFFSVEITGAYHEHVHPHVAPYIGGAEAGGADAAGAGLAPHEDPRFGTDAAVEMGTVAHESK